MSQAQSDLALPDLLVTVCPYCSCFLAGEAFFAVEDDAVLAPVLRLIERTIRGRARRPAQSM